MKPSFALIVEVFLCGQHGECDLHPQEHPIVDKLPHLDLVQSFGHGIHDLVRIGHGFLGNTLRCCAYRSGNVVQRNTRTKKQNKQHAQCDMPAQVVSGPYVGFQEVH